MYVHVIGDGVTTRPVKICGFAIFGTETKTKICIERESCNTPNSNQNLLNHSNCNSLKKSKTGSEIQN